MSYSGTQTTRLGVCAIPRSLYGSFAGKSTATTSNAVATGHTLIARADGRLLTVQADDRTLTVRPDGRRITVH